MTIKLQCISLIRTVWNKELPFIETNNDKTKSKYKKFIQFCLIYYSWLKVIIFFKDQKIMYNDGPYKRNPLYRYSTKQEHSALRLHGNISKSDQKSIIESFKTWYDVFILTFTFFKSVSLKLYFQVFVAKKHKWENHPGKKSLKSTMYHLSEFIIFVFPIFNWFLSTFFCLQFVFKMGVSFWIEKSVWINDTFWIKNY